MSKGGLHPALFSKTGIFIVIYILVGMFVNIAPPHVPTMGANLGVLHSWVQYFISILFWPLSFGPITHRWQMAALTDQLRMKSPLDQAERSGGQ